MATTISISTAGLTATNTYANDAAAQTVLLRCARRIGVPDDATNQQKLQRVLDWLVTQIQQQAAEQQFDDDRSDLLQQAQEGNKLR